MLNTKPNIEQPDLFYKQLAQMYENLSEEQSLLVSSKLILLLANHIGDHQILSEAISIAAAN